MATSADSRRLREEKRRLYQRWKDLGMPGEAELARARAVVGFFMEKERLQAEARRLGVVMLPIEPESWSPM